MATQQPLINGRAFAWSDIQIDIFGTIVRGVRSINYKETQDKKDNLAGGVEPTSRTYGQKTYTASMELEMKEVERIRDAMTGSSKSLVDVPPFTITISFMKNYRNVTHKLLNVEFTDDGNDLKAGEGVNAQLALIFAGIEYS